MLAQIESEKGGELPLKQADETGRDSTEIGEPHISRDDVENQQVMAVSLTPVADEGLVARYIEPETPQPVILRDRQAKRTLRPRRLALQPKENTSVLSDQPTAQPQVVTSTIERDIPPKKSRFGRIVICFCLFMIAVLYFQVPSKSYL